METTTTTLTDWTAGKPCERHDLAYCTDCRDHAKIVRTRDGALHYKSDCAVQTFSEVTGASYAEALAALGEAGYIPGRGTPKGGVSAALTAAGFQVIPYGGRIESLPGLSRTGRVFFVSATKGRKGHAWSVVGGKANRPYQPPFRYQVFEVTA